MSIEQQKRIGRPPSCVCGECQKCKNALYMRRWWGKLTPEQRREKTARRNPDVVALHEQNRERPPEHKERERVRLSARRAVASGKLTRENCERCGSPFTQAHHEDYGEPLNVNWYCPYHHSERHRERAIEAGIHRDSNF